MIEACDKALKLDERCLKAFLRSAAVPLVRLSAFHWCSVILGHRDQLLPLTCAVDACVFICGAVEEGRTFNWATLLPPGMTYVTC